MRVICPHCMTANTVAEEMAGKDVTCSNCGKTFPTPARYTATVAEAASAVASAPVPPAAPPAASATAPTSAAPPVPPGYVPPAPPTPPATADGFLPNAGATGTAEPTPPEGYTKSCGITISPKAVAWLPAMLLTVVFVFTFFPWVGSYAGSSAVYSQRPWGAMFSGTPNRNYKLEEAGTIPVGWLDKMRSDWKVLVPFMLVLVVALAFAWAERGLRTLDPRKVPPLAKLWPWRNTIIAGCAAFLLLLLMIQLLNGFGMERAIKQHISEQFAERRANVANSPASLAKLEYDEEQAFSAYNVEHTWWFYLSILCTAGAVLGVFSRIALDRRGDKPAPKIMIHY